MNNRFARGTGRFQCKMCGKQTRDVDGNGDVELCQLCNEKSMYENSLSDGGFGKHGDLEHCKTVEEVHSEYNRLSTAAHGATTTTTLDITPSWSGILPILLRVHEDATTHEARATALGELRRMAELADAYVAEHKS